MFKLTKIKDKRIIFFLLVVVVFLIMTYAKSLMPKCITSIEQASPQVPESPLAYSINGNFVDFKLTVNENKGTYDKVKCNTKLMFLRNYPYVSADNTVKIVVYESKNKDKGTQETDKVTQEKTSFIISGTVENKFKNNFKIRVENNYNTLLDEILVDNTNKN
jgi:hypothetical protein